MKPFNVKTLAALCIACTSLLVPLASSTTMAAPSVPRAAAAQPAPAATPAPPRGFGGPGRGNADVVSGRLAGITAQAIQLQSFSGVQSIERTAGTRFYIAGKSSASALHAGVKVTVRSIGGPTASLVITIAPSGNLYGFVQAFQNAPAGTAPRPAGTPNRGNFNPANRRFVAPVEGTVTSLQGSKLTVKTTQGKTATYTTSSSTEVYVFSQVSSSAIHAGAEVGVTTATVSGHKVAVAVASTSVANATVFLTAQM